MNDRTPKQRAFFAALRSTVPVLWGYLAIGMTFGCMLRTQTGHGWPVAMCMSLLIYAGAMQFLAVPLIAQGAPLPQIALLTLLLNARHMVYGLSLFDTFDRCGRGKPYAIFGLTDEAYALHTGTKPPEDADPGAYTLWVAGLCQAYWVIGSVVGNVAASLFEFNTMGIDFALTALFLVILHGQWQQYRSKLPFAVGAVAGLLLSVLMARNTAPEVLFALIAPELRGWPLLLAIAVMAAITLFTRAFPFLFFTGGRRPSALVLRLGRVLPPAVIALLVVYCLKDVRLNRLPYGLPEAVACALVLLLQHWKRSAILSIGVGTLAYMAMVQFLFV